MEPCVLCNTFDGHSSESPMTIALQSTPHGSVCSPCVTKMLAQALKQKKQGDEENE